MKKKKIVIALGHDALGTTLPEQKKATKDIYFTITGLTNVLHEVILNSTGGWSLSGLFDYYTFADGTPFGVKKEE